MKRLASTLLVLTSLSSHAQWSTSGSNINNTNTGNVGIGTSSPTAKLEINLPAAGSGQNQGLRIWGGNSYNYFGNTQINFAWGGGAAYSHALKTRHMSNAVEGNAFDFYVWQPGDAVSAEGSLHTMSLNGGKVGIGTTAPVYKLDVQGPANDWKGRFQGPDGYITIGPANSAWAHIYSDRPAFLFNQPVYSQPGVFSSYSPADLTLQTFGTTRMTILNSNGNVGIGTNAPTLGKLHVAQSADASDQGIAIMNSTGGRVMRLWADPSNSYVYSGATGQGNLILNGTGNVGVGTVNPNQKLTVNGTIYGKEVKVDLNVPGPDYVFEKNYKLPSLDEIKSYVDQHKHLPEVPSAKEMEQNGINLSEMNMILLKKVEELTLMMINQNQENEELKISVAHMQEELITLKSKIK